MQAQSTSGSQLHGLSSRTAVTHEQADPQQVSGVLVAPEPLALLEGMTASHDLYDENGWSPISKSRSTVRLPLEAISTYRFASPPRPREPPLPVSGTQL